jgi:hypothetical protein
MLYKIHPSKNSLSIQSVSLRYIDAIMFDFENNNILSFMEENLQIKTSFAEEPFNKTNTRNIPVTIDIRYTFP